jgi:hypothetical protein
LAGLRRCGVYGLPDVAKHVLRARRDGDTDQRQLALDATGSGRRLATWFDGEQCQFPLTGRRLRHGVQGVLRVHCQLLGCPHPQLDKGLAQRQVILGALRLPKISSEHVKQRVPGLSR